MKKYYVRATGSTCYDKTGITFPEKVSIDFDSLLEDTKNVQWENQFGWSNQPKVITFHCTKSLADKIDSSFPFNYGLIVVDCDW